MIFGKNFYFQDDRSFFGEKVPLEKNKQNNKNHTQKTHNKTKKQKKRETKKPQQQNPKQSRQI